MEGVHITWGTTYGVIEESKVHKIVGWGMSEVLGEYFTFYSDPSAGSPTFMRSVAVGSITHLNRRKVNSTNTFALGQEDDEVDFREGQLTFGHSTKGDGMAKTLTKTRKSLDDMSDQHRKRIEFWEGHMENLRGVHVWFHVFRIPGRNVEGPCFVAVKRGDKDYMICEYDTAKPYTVTPKFILEDGIETSGQLTDAFRQYRAQAKEERAEARPAKKESTKKPDGKKKAPAKKTPAKKPVGKAKSGAKKPARKAKPARAKK